MGDGAGVRRPILTEDREGAHGAPRRGAGQWAPASDGEGFGALAPSEKALIQNVEQIAVLQDQIPPRPRWDGVT